MVFAVEVATMSGSTTIEVESHDISVQELKLKIRDVLGYAPHSQRLYRDDTDVGREPNLRWYREGVDFISLVIVPDRDDPLIAVDRSLLEEEHGHSFSDAFWKRIKDYAAMKFEEIETDICDYIREDYDAPEEGLP